MWFILARVGFCWLVGSQCVPVFSAVGGRVDPLQEHLLGAISHVSYLSLWIWALPWFPCTMKFREKEFRSLNWKAWILASLGENLLSPYLGQQRERERSFLFSSSRGTNFIPRTPPTWPNPLSKAYLQIPSLWGLGLQHQNFRRTQTFSL